LHNVYFEKDNLHNVYIEKDNSFELFWCISKYALCFYHNADFEIVILELVNLYNKYFAYLQICILQFAKRQFILQIVIL